MNLLGTERVVAAGSSLPDTLSLLHYCGSCSEQCNNERASVSWAQPRACDLHPCLAKPLNQAPPIDSSPTPQ